MAASAARRKQSLYETDWQAWVTQQEAIARAGRGVDLDLVNLAEELRDEPRADVNARRRAALETGLPTRRFPAGCPYSLANILDPEFWPGPGPHPE